MESGLAKWDDFEIRVKIWKLMGIEDSIGLIIRVGLLAGISEKEMPFLHAQDVCTRTKCHCENIHVIDKMGLTIIFVQPSDIFTSFCLSVLPSKLWRDFRALSRFGVADIGLADMLTTVSYGLEFNQLHEIYLNVIHTSLEEGEARLLLKAPVDSTNIIWDGSHSLLQAYRRAWERFGILV